MRIKEITKDQVLSLYFKLAQLAKALNQPYKYVISSGPFATEIRYTIVIERRNGNTDVLLHFGVSREAYLVLAMAFREEHQVFEQYGQGGEEHLMPKFIQI